MSEIQYLSVKVSNLIPNLNNARTHSEQQVDKIAASIREFKFMNPVIIDADFNIIAGHGRVMAAKSLGMAEVPCLLTTHLTEDQKRAYILADNRLALDAGWDNNLLKVELEALDSAGFDLGLTGFDLKEIKIILDQSPIHTDEDDVPEPPRNPTARLGDIWTLGTHRVLCGDSTDAEVILGFISDMGAYDRPPIMVTDPPYGVSYDAKWRTKIIDPRNKKKKTVRAKGRVLNDDKASWAKAWALFPGDVAYIWHAGLHASTVESDIKACGFEIRSQII